MYPSKTRTTRSAQPYHTHLERPHPADPDLELVAFQPLDIIQLDTLPPAPAGRLPPEEKQLLRHTHRAAAHLVAADIRPQPRQRQAADNSLVWLAGPVTPSVIMVEATGTLLEPASFPSELNHGTHPAVNISIRCASVVPGSSLLFRPLKMPSCLSKARAAARLTSIISAWPISFLCGMA